MQTVLKAQNLWKTFSTVQIRVDAVRGVNLSVSPGEFVVIMGPSGSGKSTLLHILGAMEKPTSGKVWIEDQEISDLADRDLSAIRRHKLGFVFQRPSLLPTLTARANIDVARSLHHARLDGAARGRLDELLSLLLIRDKMDHRPAELSGGEQQRVAIARAVIDQPAIVLADEPTGNLDSENSNIILSMFRRLNDVYGQTIIVVTHDPDMAAYGRRLIRMRDGKVISDSGTPATAIIA